jgi:hypothetical protein
MPSAVARDQNRKSNFSKKVEIAKLQNHKNRNRKSFKNLKAERNLGVGRLQMPMILFVGRILWEEFAEQANHFANSYALASAVWEALLEPQAISLCRSLYFPLIYISI